MGSNAPSSVWATGGWQEGNLTEIKPAILQFRAAKPSKICEFLAFLVPWGLSVATSLEKTHKKTTKTLKI